jgi:alpha-tubulin suppressor-like RCC1 family protein
MTYSILQPIAGTLLLLAGLALPAQTQAGGVPGRLDDAVAVSVGADHSCALRKTATGSDYAAYCWGSDEFGQLGHGGAGDRSTPVVVSTLFEGVRQLAAGRHHSCAVKTDGTLWCWGLNNAGQLGLGDKVDRETPQQVTLPANVEAAYVRAGTSHSCVVASNTATPTDFELYCWGSNTFGQLGTSDQVERLSPALADINAPVAGIALGANHTCALRQGNVGCWGNGFKGQVGNGSSALVNATPQFVEDAGGGLLNGSKIIDTGAEFSCAMVEEFVSGLGITETIYCWGDNASRQIGRADTSLDFNQAVPLFEFTRVTAGDTFACGYADFGNSVRLQCWGDNSDGQLGRGTTGGSFASPDDVFGVPRPPINGIPFNWTSGFDEQVSAGRAHACMVVGAPDGDYTFGYVQCWGANDSGQLGDGSTTDRSQPVWVTPPPPRPVDLELTIAPASTPSFGDPIDIELEITGEAPTGTVNFTRGFVTLCANVPVNDAGSTLGRASCSTSAANAGSLPIQAAYSGDDRNASATISRAYTIDPAAQTIAFPQPPDQTFVNGATFAVGATASSGLAVSFASLTASICSVSGSTVTMLDEGSCTIRASQSGNGNFLAAPDVQRTVELTSTDSMTSLTANPPSPSEFGDSIDLQATVTGTSPTGTVTFRLDAVVICSNVALIAGEAGCSAGTVDAGTVSFSASYSGDGDNDSSNASLVYVVNKADQSITFPQPPDQAFAEGVTFALNATASSGLVVSYASLSPSVCSISGSTVSLLSDGDCLIRATQAGNDNYNAAAPVERTVEVSPDQIFTGDFELES